MEGKHVLSENVALLSATTGRALGTPGLSHCLPRQHKLTEQHELGDGVANSAAQV